MRRSRAEERPAADLRQGAPDVVLEDDDDDQQERAEEVVEDPVEGVELEVLRRQVTKKTTASPMSICAARVPRMRSMMR